MAKHHVSAAATGLPSHPAVFLAITPEIRRALELLAEASIALLDEIDAPIDEIEADPDFELTLEDDEANGDHEPNFGWTAEGCMFGGDDEREPNLGWTNDGDPTGGDIDEDLVGAETSGGFPARISREAGDIVAARALFDPRIGLRPEPRPREWIEHPNGLRFAPFTWTAPTIPAFPHDAPGRAEFLVREEVWRLCGELARMAPKRKRRPHRRSA